MKAIIVAAGYATRLYPWTFNTPKALLPINKKPIIDYIVDELNTISEIDEIYVVTNRRFAQHFTDWAKTAPGKTPISVLDDGTTSDEKDLWFVGGTPYYVTAVWWGYDAPYDMTNTLGKQQAKTRTCVMAWKAYMEQVQANLPYKAFPTSDGVVERAYCTQSGLLAGANCPSRATGYYRADDLPDTCNYSHSSGVAAAQSADTAPVVGQDTTGMDTD